jgi:hypothetical protein
MYLQGMRQHSNPGCIPRASAEAAAAAAAVWCVAAALVGGTTPAHRVALGEAGIADAVTATALDFPEHCSLQRVSEFSYMLHFNMCTRRYCDTCSSLSASM